MPLASTPGIFSVFSLGHNSRVHHRTLETTPAFSSEAVASGATCTRRFFEPAASGEFVLSQFLSDIILGGYGAAAVAASCVATAHFIYRPIGFHPRVLGRALRPRHHLMSSGESVNIHSSVSSWERESWGSLVALSVPELIPPPVD